MYIGDDRLTQGTKSVLARYLDGEVLNAIGNAHIEPRSLVLGNLAGAHKSPLSGFAVEFAGHREYVWGDDPKHIDWRLYFNRDRYFIKQYEMETNFVCHLVLDISASMRYGQGDQQKLLYAARMATMLGYSIVRQSDKVSLATFDEHVRGFVPPSNSMAQIVKMTAHLDQVQPVEKTSITQCLTELAGRMHRREIVMLFSDFLGGLDDLEKALQRLRYQKHEVVLFHVLHHDELAFQFDGMVKFQGLETAEEHLTQPDDIRRSYLAALQRFIEQFDEICQRNHIERIQVDTSQNMAAVLADYLNQRRLRRR